MVWGEREDVGEWGGKVSCYFINNGKRTIILVWFVSLVAAHPEWQALIKTGSWLTMGQMNVNRIHRIVVYNHL